MQVKEFVKTEDRLLNRTILLYGPTKTGKTVLTLDIMNYLRQFVPICIVMAPSNSTQRAFSGIVPDQLIFNECTIEMLKMIWQRQEAVTFVKGQTNDVTILSQLFAMHPNPAIQSYMSQLYGWANAMIGKAAANLSLSDDAKAKYRDDVAEKINAYVVPLLKSHLRSYSTTYAAMQLTNEQSMCLKYQGINNNLLLVCDDCAADIKKYIKDPIIKRMFYQGRHYGLTIIFTAQDDTNIDKDLRKQVTTNIFTGPQCADHYFRNNDFDKQTIDKGARSAIGVLGGKFDANGQPLHYRQLVYLRDDAMFFVYEAKSFGKFRFGFDAAWQLCGGVAKKESMANCNNPILRSA